MHVAAYVEELQQRISAPSVKLQLASIRMLFDLACRGTGHSDEFRQRRARPEAFCEKGETPVLTRHRDPYRADQSYVAC